MQHQRLIFLFRRAMDKTMLPDEHRELHNLMAEEENRELVEQLFEEYWQQFETNNHMFDRSRGSAILDRILSVPELPSGKKQVYRYLQHPWVRVAAVLMLVAASALYFLPSMDQQPHDRLSLTEAAQAYGIEPGSDKAILTLGDGRVVVLDDINNGLVANDLGTSILKSEGGQLRYDQTDTPPEAVAYNSIRIPKGGQYRLVLPDGSRVHLNSESFIKFPTRFSGDRREVELIGEAYFEIAHDKEHPFYVKTPKQTTKVLGTVFNVSAYADDATTKTTLVEGSVEVFGYTGKPIILKPGQAAVNGDKLPELSVVRANLDTELAWQNGYFVFNNEDIKSIMKRISRWYDVDVEYQGDLEHKRFGGIFQRSKSIAQLLDNFKETGIIDFKIVERRIIVIGK